MDRHELLDACQYAQAERHFCTHVTVVDGPPPILGSFCARCGLRLYGMPCPVCAAIEPEDPME
jgi:hypothetical protein